MRDHTVVCWGELVWDRFGDELALGGCACNVAVGLAGYGRSVKLITRLGDDELGRAALDQLQAVGVDTSLIQVDAQHPTASVNVHLDQGQPRYTMERRMDWSRLGVTPEAVRALENCTALVYGTLTQRKPVAQEALSQARHHLRPGALQICDLNLRGPPVSVDLLEHCVRDAHAIKLNETEAKQLKSLCGADAIAWLREQMNVQLVALTLGERGAELHGAHGRVATAATVPREVEQGANSVGAGDAFCARLVHGLLAGEAAAALLSDCSEAAARVVGRRNANLLG